MVDKQWLEPQSTAVVADTMETTGDHRAIRTNTFARNSWSNQLDNEPEWLLARWLA